MNGKIYLINSGGNKLLTARIKEGAVGSHRAFKAERGGEFNKIRKVGMCKRLTHNVKIDVIGYPYERGYYLHKLLHCHSAPFPFGTGTEGAVSVTYIGYFQIYS
jgi:hypothetical protein